MSLTFGAGLVMKKASRDGYLLFEKFAIRRQEYSVLFNSQGTQGFWLSVNYFAVIALAVDGLSNLG